MNRDTKKEKKQKLLELKRIPVQVPVIVKFNHISLRSKKYMYITITSNRFLIIVKK